MKKLLLAAALALSPAAMAFTPWQGQWWNPNESGSGYNIDVQNGLLVITIFSYEPSGDSEWYVASGPLTSSGRVFSGRLEKYRNGQCISCPYAGSPSGIGNDGSFTITFTDEVNATMQLPGRSTAIVPYRFGVETLPRGLFGEWVFTYDIISTWADRFNFSEVIAGTSNGVGGMAYDSARYAACELQATGATAGYVLCVDLTSAGVRQNAYAWKYGLDQTYDGAWISPTTSTFYVMKGMRTEWPNGQSKQLLPGASEPGDRMAAKAGEEEALAIEPAVKALHAEAAMRLEAMAARIREVRAYGAP